MPIISGIYAIRNITDDKFYIGSATSLAYRHYDHTRKLRRNGHSNPHLQRAWNKYGEINFEFLILEYCEPEKLIEKEQWWIDLTNCFIIGYNRNPTAGSSLGLKRSEESRAKMSAAKKGKKLTEEHRQNIQLASQKNNISIIFICKDGRFCKCDKCKNIRNQIRYKYPRYRGQNVKK